MTNKLNNKYSFKSLIELGSKGLFPLFHSNWLENYELNISSDKAQINSNILSTRIINRLNRTPSLEQKKSIIHALSVKDRKTFISIFLNMVEKQIRTKNPELH